MISIFIVSICVLLLLVIAVYISFVITTLIISEDFDDRVSYKVAFILPILLNALSISIAIKNFKTNKRLFKTSIKMATVDYAVATTLAIGMVKDHQAQVQVFGDSIYSKSATRNILLKKKDKNKSWLKSLGNIKNFLSSDEFKKDFASSISTT
ncbi:MULTISPECIES: hypothetical protein [Bacillati]|uniref:hypothetical protein n=1 Tax=Bacillati TaxID=1783272 RepID=UPI00138DF82B